MSLIGELGIDRTPNFRRRIGRPRLLETPNIGVDETSSRPIRATSAKLGPVTDWASGRAFPQVRAIRFEQRFLCGKAHWLAALGYETICCNASYRTRDRYRG